MAREDGAHILAEAIDCADSDADLIADSFLWKILSFLFLVPSKERYMLLLLPPDLLFAVFEESHHHTV